MFPHQLLLLGFPAHEVRISISNPGQAQQQVGQPRLRSAARASIIRNEPAGDRLLIECNIQVILYSLEFKIITNYRLSRNF